MNQESQHELDALETFDRLRDSLFRYYDTPFGLANEELQRKRRDLLNQDGVAWRRPLLEVRPQYVSSGLPIADSVAEAGAPPEMADLLNAGMLRSEDRRVGKESRCWRAR